MLELLILGTLRDPHIKRVHERLLQKGISCDVVDMKEPPKVRLQQSRSAELHVSINGEEIGPGCLIWDRMKLFIGSFFYYPNPQDDTAYARFAMGEWRALRDLLVNLFPHQTVNNPLTSPRMSQKILQQVVANEVGLATPTTLLTNQQDVAVEFVESSGPIITKSFAANVIPNAPGSVPPMITIMTTPVTSSEIGASSRESFEACPVMLQSEIRKDYELRIEVVGDNVFPFSIDSQRQKYSRIDWRLLSHALEFKPVRIADDLKSRIYSFMNRFDQFSGSLDFIVDRSGQHWFLECNSQGAWAWLDDEVDGIIADAFADALEARLVHLRRLSEDAPNDQLRVVELLSKLCFQNLLPSNEGTKATRESMHTKVSA